MAKWFTDDQMKRIFSTHLVDLALKNGFEIESEDAKVVKFKGRGGLVVFRHGRGFYNFSTGQQGNVLDFAKEYLGARSTKEAGELILEERAEGFPEKYTKKNEVKPAIFQLPEQDKEKKHAYAYLIKTRGLDREIVDTLFHENKIYQTVSIHGDQTYRSCAFVGYDHEGVARYCTLRSVVSSSKFKQDAPGSSKEFPFVLLGRSHTVFVFESPIDAISHASLCKITGDDWTLDHRIATGGLSSKGIDFFLSHHPEIRTIAFCYDNDLKNRMDGKEFNPGQERAKKLSKEYSERGYEAICLPPRFKDYNEELLEMREVEQEILRIREESERSL